MKKMFFVFLLLSFFSIGSYASKENKYDRLEEATKIPVESVIQEEEIRLEETSEEEFDGHEDEDFCFTQGPVLNGILAKISEEEGEKVTRQDYQSVLRCIASFLNKKDKLKFRSAHREFAKAVDVGWKNYFENEDCNPTIENFKSLAFWRNCSYPFGPLASEEVDENFMRFVECYLDELTRYTRHKNWAPYKEKRERYLMNQICFFAFHENLSRKCFNDGFYKLISGCMRYQQKKRIVMIAELFLKRDSFLGPDTVAKIFQCQYRRACSGEFTCRFVSLFIDRCHFDAKCVCNACDWIMACRHWAPDFTNHSIIKKLCDHEELEIKDIKNIINKLITEIIRLRHDFKQFKDESYRDLIKSIEKFFTKMLKRLFKRRELGDDDRVELYRLAAEYRLCHLFDVSWDIRQSAFEDVCCSKACCLCSDCDRGCCSCSSILKDMASELALRLKNLSLK